MSLFRIAAAAAVLSVAGPGLACTQSVPQGEQRSAEHAFRVATVTEGLANPWGMAFLPGGDILVTERPGRLRIIRDGRLSPTPVAGIPEVRAQGQGGLMDVALHPDFESNRLVYLSYSKPGAEGATTAVIRGKLEGDRLVDVQEIFEARAWSTRGAHFGSRLVFDGRGHLFVSIGDRGDRTDLGEQQNAQDLGTHAGKILRLTEDGGVPPDNPFVGRAGALPEIWAYGIRSPQGMALHPETGELWETEHGPRGGDEINLIRPGRNYGWPVVTYGINYNGTSITDLTEKEGMEQPLHHWVPSIATSGLAIYEGDAFPRWRGDVFVGGLAGQHLARVSFDGTRRTGSEKLLEGIGRIRDVRVGPQGYLYLLIDSGSAPLLRLEPVEGTR